jgi:hypothetical protein
MGFMKYPNLRELSQGPPLGMSDGHFRAVKEMAEGVCASCGVDAWIDTLSEEVVFGHRNNGDVETIIGFALFKGRSTPCHFDPAIDRWCAEDAKYAVWLARQPMSRKKRQLAWNQRNRKADDRELMGQLLEEDGNHWLDRKATRGRSSLVVDGRRA